jgi:hypothetical protein
MFKTLIICARGRPAAARAPIRGSGRQRGKAGRRRRRRPATTNGSGGGGLRGSARLGQSPTDPTDGHGTGSGPGEVPRAGAWTGPCGLTRQARPLTGVEGRNPGPLKIAWTRVSGEAGGAGTGDGPGPSRRFVLRGVVPSRRTKKSQRLKPPGLRLGVSRKPARWQSAPVQQQKLPRLGPGAASRLRWARHSGVRAQCAYPAPVMDKDQARESRTGPVRCGRALTVCLPAAPDQEGSRSADGRQTVTEKGGAGRRCLSQGYRLRPSRHGAARARRSGPGQLHPTASEGPESLGRCFSHSAGGLRAEPAP